MSEDEDHTVPGATLLSLAGEGVDAERRRMRGITACEVSLIRHGFAVPPSPASGRRVAPLAVGIGFRTRCSGETLAALVREAFVRLPVGIDGASAVLATIAEKDRPPLREAAALLGLPVLILPKSVLAGTEDRITIASDRVRACHGIPSVAEAAALAAAGPGARLVVTRISGPDATCAIALGSPP